MKFSSVFITQLEKAREATDLANIRASYAEVMVKAVTEPSTTVTGDAVTLTQAQDGWTTTDAQTTLEKLAGAAANVTGIPSVCGTCTIKYTAPTGAATEGTVTIAFASK